VLAERAERLVRTVRRRRQAVGAEADPGEEGDERELVERLGIARVLRGTEEELAEPGERTCWSGHGDRSLRIARLNAGSRPGAGA
jgi:hypothetical protein